MRHIENSLNTKKALSQALKDTMRKKEFRKITVSELIEICDVNRKTFYYHFEDIYDLLKWTLEQEAIEVVKHYNLLVDYKEAILFIMDYVEQNDFILNCAFDSIGRDELKRFFYADFEEIAISIIDAIEKEENKQLEKEYKQFLSIFYTEAVAGILIDWIKNRDRNNKDTVIKYIYDTMKNSLVGIFDNYK